MFLHYVDTAIFMLGYFILPHPVQEDNSYNQFHYKSYNDISAQICVPYTVAINSSQSTPPGKQPLTGVAEISFSAAITHR